MTANSQSNIEQILNMRAEILARSVDITEKRVVAEIVVVVIGRERFGIPIQFIVKVIPLPPVHHLPGTPSWLPGIIQLYGEPICIVDLACLFSIDSSGQQKITVIVQQERRELGLTADALIEIKRLEERDISEQYTPSKRTRQWPVGMTTKDLISVLDIDALFRDSRISS